MNAKDPEGAAIFNAAMTSFTSAFDAAVVAAYDFSRPRMLVDVGGGQGALISSILRANPDLRGILFDIPPVIDGARRRLVAGGLGDRLQLVAGDVFASVPRAATPTCSSGSFTTGTTSTASPSCGIATARWRRARGSCSWNESFRSASTRASTPRACSSPT